MFSKSSVSLIEGAAVYPVNDYYKEVAIRPVWVDESDHSLGIRVLLFSDVFVTTTDQMTSEQEELGRIKVISRSMEQPAVHIPSNPAPQLSFTDNTQSFEWVLPWSPIKGTKAIASHPSNVEKMPFVSISTELPCRVSDEPLTVPFRFFPIKDNDSFVIKKGTPIVDLLFI